MALTLVFAAGPLRAEESANRAEARAHFDEGLASARAERYVEAVAAFEAAYATSPNYAVLYNLGQAYVTLGRAVEAAHTFERFLTQGGDEIEPRRRREVEALLEQQRALLGLLELEVAPAGSEVFLDGKSLGTGPFAAQDVMAGEHFVVARSPGYFPLIRSLEVPARETLSLELELETVPEPATVASASAAPPVVRPPAPSPPAAAGHTDARRTWALGVGSVGVALAGAAVATYVWNDHRYADWQRQRDAFDASAAGGSGGSMLADRGTALAGRAADVQRVDDLALGFAVAAGAALVTAGILWFTAPPAEHRRAAAAVSR